MNPLHVLFLALFLAATALAQENPPAPPQPPVAEPVTTPDPAQKRMMDATSQERAEFLKKNLERVETATKEATPVETVQPAIPVKNPAGVALPSDKPVSFTPEQVREIEVGLKKQMMLVGMGSGVLGLLLGMAIGRKTAPRPTGRRF